MIKGQIQYPTPSKVTLIKSSKFIIIILLITLHLLYSENPLLQCPKTQKKNLRKSIFDYFLQKPYMY